MAAKPIPDGYHSITPRLFVENADEMVEFLKKAFGASERPRADHRSPAELVIGDSIVIVSSAAARRPTSSALYLYVADVDACYQAALRAGATSLEDPRNMFYGDRRATVEDRHGNLWQIATHLEDVSPQEIARRLNA